MAKKSAKAFVLKIPEIDELFGLMSQDEDSLSKLGMDFAPRINEIKQALLDNEYDSHCDTSEYSQEEIDVVTRIMQQLAERDINNILCMVCISTRTVVIVTFT